MTKELCTLFDKNYLIRALALYDSLCAHCPDFRLWTLCLDDESYSLLKQMNLPRISLVNMREFEDGELLAIKPKRTPREYCWTISSSFPLYVLKTFKVPEIAYLDADLYFYDSPRAIYDECAKSSIMVIPHRYPDKNKHMEEISGIYNVGMLTFKNDKPGMACLEWWRKKNIEWCHAYYDKENKRYGDQMYLNSWPDLFKEICILKNQGANVASWNIERYELSTNNGRLSVIDKATKETWPLIFYHFHGFKIYIGIFNKIRGYPVTILEKNIYGRYLGALNDAAKKVWRIRPDWKFGFDPKPGLLRIIKQSANKLFK